MAKLEQQRMLQEQLIQKQKQAAAQK
jgi:hypothetical protein